MSNVKKPEPVAWHINKENRKEAFLTDLASDAEIHIALSERYKGISVVPLITTIQSEAYKDACVREVLEQAYAKLDEVGAQLQQAREDRNDDYWSGVGSMVEAGEEAIRALITKQ